MRRAKLLPSLMAMAAFVYLALVQPLFVTRFFFFGSSSFVVTPHPNWDDAPFLHHRGGGGEKIEFLPRADRAIYFSILGAQKSGTTALGSYLTQHPQVVGQKYAFLTWHFGPYVNKTSRSCKNLYGNHNDGVLARWSPSSWRASFSMKPSDTDACIFVHEARKGAVSHFYPESLSRNRSSVAFDNTPDNLLYSLDVAPRMKAAFPRTKLIATLRDPIDRAWSNYNMERKRLPSVKKLSFEEYIEIDLKNLERAGVIVEGDGGDNNSTMKTWEGAALSEEKEDVAWQRYLQRPGGNDRPIGRGFYSIQLRHWFNEYQDLDTNRKQFLVTEYKELFKDGAQAAFDSVASFIGLSHHQLEDVKPVRVGGYTESMDNSTRRMLECLYGPYNQRLVGLLGDEWRDRWQYASSC